MLDKWLKSNNLKNEERFKDLELKHAELENQILKNSVELEQIKNALKETQLSLQLVLNSYQGLSEEISVLYEALKSLASPSKNSFRFSFRDSEWDDDDDDDGGNNWN